MEIEAPNQTKEAPVEPRQPDKHEDFINRLFEYYPPFIKKDYTDKNIILLNGINYDNLTQTEVAYFLCKEPTIEPIVDDGLAKSKRNTLYSTHEVNVDQIVHSEVYVDTNGKDAKGKEKQTPQEELKFCICNGTASAIDNMQINCDNCQRWYHPLCMKISKIEIALINSHDKNKWYCRNCLRGSPE